MKAIPNLLCGGRGQQGRLAADLAAESTSRVVLEDLRPQAASCRGNRIGQALANRSCGAQAELTTSHFLRVLRILSRQFASHAGLQSCWFPLTAFCVSQIQHSSTAAPTLKKKKWENESVFQR